MRESYLYPTLEAGSSRVFNICHHTLRLQGAAAAPAAGAEAKYFFKTPDLNNVVIVKEPRAKQKIDIFDFENPVGTKLYFPYDCEKIYKGGKSLFTDDRNFSTILQDHVGFDAERDAENAANDLALLGVLQSIPSLDPFLVKDKLQIEGLEVNDSYFDMPDDTWTCIRDHVAERLSPIIAFVYEESEAMDDDRVANLVHRLWNSKDIDTLMPIVETFRLPVEHAGEIFAAWKGVMYFEYEYARCLPVWKDYAAWLKDAKCCERIDRKQSITIESIRNAVTKEFRANWIELKDIFESYGAAYNQLFVERETPAPFVAFMKNAVDTYWSLGAKICTVSHCVSVWRILTSEQERSALKYDELVSLLEIERRILQGF